MGFNQTICSIVFDQLVLCSIFSFTRTSWHGKHGTCVTKSSKGPAKVITATPWRIMGNVLVREDYGYSAMMYSGKVLQGHT